MPSLTNSHFPVILICPRINITRNGSAVKPSPRGQVTDMIAELRHDGHETQSVSLSDSEAESVSDSDSK